MQDLRVIGVENGALLVASDEGTRFRIPIDEVLQSKLRQTVPEPGAGRKLAPREIQAHIRSGMSAQDVAAITGVPLDYIQKFEGPVLAEREYVVDSALKVPVHTALDTDPLAQGTTFGTAIRERLYDLNAVGERWASWKESGAGWVVKLSFTANQIDHDARWRFDPRKLSLTPLNSEAVTLSQQGEGTGALIPRLRAVATDDREPDASRFDSGAFEIASQATGQAPALSTHPAGRNSTETDVAAQAQTADLLEALRRRRGERELSNFEDDDAPGISPAASPSQLGGMRLLDVPLDLPGDSAQGSPRDTAPQPTAGSRRDTAPQPGVNHTGGGKARKGRQSMPSWDEIVFGARPDDDLA